MFGPSDSDEEIPMFATAPPPAKKKKPDPKGKGRGAGKGKGSDASLVDWDPSWNRENAKGDKLCMRFNRGSCTFAGCKFAHKCAVPGCNKAHAACEHGSSANKRPRT